jgi:hypothetical protein
MHSRAMYYYVLICSWGAKISFGGHFWLLAPDFWLLKPRLFGCGSAALRGLSFKAAAAGFGVFARVEGAGLKSAAG